MHNPFEQLFEEQQAIRSELQAIKSLLTSGNNSTATSAKEIIDTKELIKRLNITEPTVIRMRKRKTLPFIQIGSAIRYDWDVVLKALENKKAKG